MILFTEEFLNLQSVCYQLPGKRLMDTYLFYQEETVHHVAERPFYQSCPAEAHSGNTSGIASATARVGYAQNSL